MPYVRLAGLVTVTLGSLFLAGCSDDQPGSPVSPAVSSEHPPETQGEVFAGIDACDLLKPYTSRRSYDPAKEDALGGAASGCLANKPSFGTASIALRDDKSLDDVVVDNGIVSDIQISGRAARQLEEAGQCLIAIEVADQARADVLLTISVGNADPCEETKPLAEEIAKALPGG